MTDVALYDDTTSPVDATNGTPDTVSVYISANWVTDGGPTIIQVDPGDVVFLDFAAEVEGTYSSRPLGDY
ncbi:MAG: hypothetical protein AAGA32_18115, partial [Pseudomonadota bacterium]